MPVKISSKIKEEIRELYNQGFKTEDIAKKVEVSPSSVKIFVKINPDTGRYFERIGEYHQYLALKNGYDSYVKYESYISIKNGFNSRTEYLIYLAKRKGFRSWGEYQKHLTLRRINPETGVKYKSSKEYQNFLARQKINPETRDNYKSVREYDKYKAIERSKRKKNKELSDLIVKILVYHDKSQKWLAIKLGVSNQSISEYINGRSMPKRKTLRKLKKILESKEIPLNKSENLESLLEPKSKGNISIWEELVKSIRSLLSN